VCILRNVSPRSIEEDSSPGKAADSDDTSFVVDFATGSAP